MCGIAGFKTSKHFDLLRGSLPGAAARLSHRGPDDSGLYFDEENGVGFAHRRLSILDLSSAGRQPMAGEDGRFHITYNGEIYNYREIRNDLQNLGHGFGTETDTEVVLAAWREWGADSLRKFIGMFAMAIWDRKERRLFLVRDRLGVKPLYYCSTPGMFLFASELKALMGMKGFDREIDPEAPALFLHYQYIPAPRTIFKNTFKLPPGRFLVLDESGQTQVTYWSLSGKPAPPANGRDETECLERLDEKLTDAVSARLVSDVPLGALLSGGVDSSLVAALMRKTARGRVRTFSIGFGEDAYNEAPWAEKIARRLETDHTELYVTPDEALRVIPDLPDIYDEPFGDSSAIPTFLVSRLTREHVTVALSGDGGDEQFCGYARYAAASALSGFLHRFPESAWKMLAGLMKWFSIRRVEQLHRLLRPFAPRGIDVENFPEKWQKLSRMIEGRGLMDLYRMTVCVWSRDEVDQLLGREPARCRFEEIFEETGGLSPLSRLMRVDQGTYLPDAMLTKVDRASMAVGLEVRVPLLDHRVVEYTANLPDRMKYRNGVGKHLLRKLLARYIPESLFERPKMGFGVPIDRWFRKELRELVLDYLSPGRLNRKSLFHAPAVERRVGEHLSGRANHHHRLWCLLMWEMWMERWMK